VRSPSIDRSGVSVDGYYNRGQAANGTGWE
jgi:hypothetical protein